jgi:hypothetical protein
LDDVADVHGCVAVVVDAGANGGVSSHMFDPLALAGGANDLSPSHDAVDSFISYLDSSSFPYPVLTDSLIDLESVLISSFSYLNSSAFKAFSPLFSQPFDLSKSPFSYTEALARSNAQILCCNGSRETKSCRHGCI